MFFAVEMIWKAGHMSVRNWNPCCVQIQPLFFSSTYSLDVILFILSKPLNKYEKSSLPNNPLLPVGNEIIPTIVVYWSYSWFERSAFELTYILSAMR